jgi:hypothetical protein
LDDVFNELVILLATYAGLADTKVQIVFEEILILFNGQ